MKIKHVFFSTLTVMAFTGCHTEAQQSPKECNNGIKVETIKIKTSEEVQSYCYSGQIESSKNIRLSFRIPGQVTKISVEEGDRIEKGQQIAEIDDSKFQSAYDAALASHHQAEDAFNRLKKVYEKGSLAEVDWQDIQAKKAKSQSALELAKQNIEDCKLIAPTSGIIGHCDIEVGMNVTPNIAVFELLKTDPLYAKISVSEKEINQFQKGQTATIEIGALGSEKFKALVEKTGVNANPISRTYEVKLLVVDPIPSIKPGMLCDVLILPQVNKQVFRLPVQSILKDDQNNSYVYIINQNTFTATPHYVETAGFSNNQVQIISGLSIGDIVVVSGQHKLSPNTKVII